jgi:hypothetical protein
MGPSREEGVAGTVQCGWNNTQASRNRQPWVWAPYGGRCNPRQDGRSRTLPSGLREPCFPWVMLRLYSGHGSPRHLPSCPIHLALDRDRGLAVEQVDPVLRACEPISAGRRPLCCLWPRTMRTTALQERMADAFLTGLEFSTDRHE